MVDYRRKLTYLIRDMAQEATPAFLVDAYGLSDEDFGVTGAPARQAVERIGLDPNRFMAVLWDGPYTGG